MLDIIFSKPLDISKLLPKIIPDEKISSVLFYFSPDVVKFNYDSLLPYEEGPLFVKGNFAVDRKHFKFPFTAQT